MPEGQAFACISVPRSTCITTASCDVDECRDVEPPGGADLRALFKALLYAVLVVELPCPGCARWHAPGHRYPARDAVTFTPSAITAMLNRYSTKEVQQRQLAHRSRSSGDVAHLDGRDDAKREVQKHRLVRLGGARKAQPPYPAQNSCASCVAKIMRANIQDCTTVSPASASLQQGVVRWESSATIAASEASAAARVAASVPLTSSSAETGAAAAVASMHDRREEYCRTDRHAAIPTDQQRRQHAQPRQRQPDRKHRDRKADHQR